MAQIKHRGTGKTGKIKLSPDDKIFYFSIAVLLGLFVLSVLYPLLYIVSASFSSPAAVSAGRVFLLPVDFSLEGYKAVFSDRYILSGYANTIFYTVMGTLVNVVMTMLAAYPLARRGVPGAPAVLFLFTFTMIFSGGMIPDYMNIMDLGIMNTRWAMVLPGAVAAYHLIIARTFLRTNIPHELLEAAQMDGCDDYRFFFSMVLPLSKAVLAVLGLYYAVGHWNAYFNAFLYLNSKELFPLQIVLRDILVANSIDINLISDPEMMTARQGMADLLKYSLILVSTVPILCIYPFIQKYFIKGAMLGSIKG